MKDALYVMLELVVNHWPCNWSHANCIDL